MRLDRTIVWWVCRGYRPSVLPVKGLRGILSFSSVEFGIGEEYWTNCVRIALSSRFIARLEWSFLFPTSCHQFHATRDQTGIMPTRSLIPACRWQSLCDNGPSFLPQRSLAFSNAEMVNLALTPLFYPPVHCLAGLKLPPCSIGRFTGSLISTLGWLFLRLFQHHRPCCF